jgi:hypothetical protein
MVLTAQVPDRTKSFVEKPAFIMACLSDVKVIMVIMHVSMVKLLRQAATEQI